MTAEQLEELLGKVTPGPWWTDARYDGREMGCSIIAARTDCGPLPGNPTRGMVAWSSAICNTDARRCESNATLIALAPSLARRVIAAEKLVREVRHYTYGNAPLHSLRSALTAYLEASK